MHCHVETTALSIASAFDSMIFDGARYVLACSLRLTHQNESIETAATSKHVGTPTRRAHGVLGLTLSCRQFLVGIL